MERKKDNKETAGGRLIVIEGPDGCGKSTHARLLGEHLESDGRSVVVTQEPTKGFIGQAIRTVLRGEAKASPEALTLLFTADRAEHVRSVIGPSLERGMIVISDRYYYSTVAYQAAQGVGVPWISQINSFVPEPDIVLVLDAPIKDALSRIGGRELEVFEVLEFQEKVRQNLLDLAYGGYKKLSRPGRKWKVISNSDDEGLVQERIRDFIDKNL